MAAAAPNSWKDPYWTDLADGVEKKLGLPTGLLASVVTKGERSNSDQVSEAGARTPFQVTPTTRRLVLNRDGIDAYLSPENAAEVAGIVLQDGVNWAKERTRDPAQIPALAAGYYHGGGDTSNWGPRTRSYVARLTSGLDTSDPASAAPITPGGMSSFDRAMASGAPSQSTSIAKTFAAYQSGKMTPDDAAAFEGEVNAGHILLPRGAALKADASRTAPPSTSAGAADGGAAAPDASTRGQANNVPPALLDAYRSGRLAPQDRQDFEALVQSGDFTMPTGAKLGDVQQQPSPGIGERLATIPGALKEAVTGAGRRTAETDALPDWATMPELNSLSMASAKTGLGTLLSNPAETAQIIKSNFPDAQVRQDAKGNYLIRSAADGREYAIKPGFQVSDIPRALGALAAFTPAGRAATIPGAAAAAGATQAAIEGTQAATGGTFNPGEVVTATAMGGAVPAVVGAVQALKNPVGSVLSRLRGTPDPAGAGEAAAAGPGAVATAPNPAAAPLPPPAPSGALTAPISGTPASGEALAAAPVLNPRAPRLLKQPAPAAESVGAPSGPPMADHTSRGVAPQRMVWKGPESDVPVTFKHVEPQAGPDGRMYARVDVDGRDSFVPADELVASSAAPPSAAQGGGAGAQGAPPVTNAGGDRAGAPPTTATMTGPELAQTAKTAAQGGFLSAGKATRTLAEQTAPDAKVIAAAKRLGVDDYLQPDHVTTNQAYRELAQAVKSVPGSLTRETEMAGLEKVGQRADSLIDEIGGTTDLSTLATSVQRRMQATQQELEQQAEQLYGKVREAIPPKTAAPADKTLAFLQQHADEVGGAGRLLPPERKLLGALEGDGKPLTYAYLDQVRKQIGQATRKASGPFADSDSGMLKKLYSTLLEDQQAVADGAGAGDLYRAASASVAVRKGLEDDMKYLFGQKLTGSLVAPLAGAVKALPTGDTSKLLGLLRAVPPEMRQEVVASGLTSAFKTAGTRGPIGFNTYAKWYEGLLRNKQAHAAIMTNLPPLARKRLSDLYRVANGIGAATRERITTGRIQAVQDQFKAADSLAGRLYDTAKRNAVGAAAGTVATHMAGPGVGAVVASALSKGVRPAADKAIDALISSPEFLQAVKAAGTPAQRPAARSLAFSKGFAAFARAVGGPRELSGRERWVLQALEGANTQGSATH